MSTQNSSPQSSAKPPNLGKLVLVAAVIVGLALIAGLVPRWRQRTRLVSETRELAIPTVSVVQPSPSKGAPASLSLSAEVRAFREAPIYARASGYLKRWLVDLGSKVEAGQLLAEIETPETDQELARAKAGLSEAEAALGLAKTTAERWADLVKTASVSQQEANEKQSDLTLKQATLEAAKAEVRRLQELQSFARVTAPFAGTITLRQTDVGQLVNAGSGRELFRLAETDKLRVYVRVPQTASRGVRAGQKAQLTVQELPGRTFEATIVRDAGAVDAASRTLLTELQVDNANGEILAGSYAQVTLPGVSSNTGLSLPSNTLLFRPEGIQVGIVGPEGKVQLRTVEVGRDFGATVEITRGVEPSDRVILNPVDSLAGGTVVRVAEASAKSE